MDEEKTKYLGKGYVYLSVFVLLVLLSVKSVKLDVNYKQDTGLDWGLEKQDVPLTDIVAYLGAIGTLWATPTDLAALAIGKFLSRNKKDKE